MYSTMAAYLWIVVSIIAGYNYVNGEGSLVSKIEGGDSKDGMVRNASSWLHSNKNQASDIAVRASNGTAVGCACGQRKASVTLREIENDFEVNRIVGGVPAELNEFPWRCALFYEDRNKIVRFYCGCSLISDQWVMTAAHCTQPLKGGKLYVDLGDHDLTKQDESLNQVIPVDVVKQHEKYNRRTMENDISLLKLRTPVRMTNAVSPVCLPFGFKNREFSSEKVTASGWGVTAEGSRRRPPILRKVDLDILPQASCRRYFPRGQITDNMICTLTPTKDACQGDSGSSIDYLDQQTGRSYAVGIVSFGRGCGRRNGPGVFTSVAKMLPWIQTTIGHGICEE